MSGTDRQRRRCRIHVGEEKLRYEEVKCNACCSSGPVRAQPYSTIGESRSWKLKISPPSPPFERLPSRRQPRFRIEVDITVNSRTCGVLKGYTVDISESGIAAVLTIEPPSGEVVELNFTLPFGPVTILAMVRQRNAFRYGFEFVEANTVNEAIHRTCRELALNTPAVQ